MLYKKLPYYGYIEFIYRYRVPLILFILTIITILVSTIRDDFTYNDDELWLQGSSEYTKLQKEKYPSSYIKKVTIDISEETFNKTTVQKLQKLQKYLETQPNVLEVDSFLTKKRIINQKISPKQQMMEIDNLNSFEPEDIFNYITRNSDEYLSYISDDFKSITYYVISSENFSISSFECKFPYTIEGLETGASYNDMILFIVLFFTLIISFSIAFKSILPSILGTIFISVTTLSTIALFQMFSHVKEIHVSIVLVALTISVMDFVYIYYKWHVIQKRLPAKHALYRVLAKTITPIFWTSVISIMAIGSLLYVDSHILYTIGMNVMLSAFSGLFFSVTLLPVMLTFFSQKDPQIITKDSSRFFANKEAHFKPWVLKGFLLLSFGAFVYGVSSYYIKPLSIKTSSESDQIQIALIDKGVTIETLKQLSVIEKELSEKFDTIISYDSAYDMIKKIHKVENPGVKFDIETIDVDSYIFSLDLYDVSKSLIIDERLTLNIFLGKNTDQSSILNYVRKKGFLIQDANSLVYLAKMDSIMILFNIVIFVLLLIMSVIFYVTRNLQFTIISLIVNIIPLIWFFAAIMFFAMPLSTEIFVAMIITVALSSDATLHFIYYYHKNRHKPRNSTSALEQSFIYVGTPIGMGNLILSITFALLIFMPNEIISNIGFYSTLLILLSLLVDLFILPVLFLHHIRNNRNVQDYFHG